jgi:hypothetical protein
VEELLLKKTLKGGGDKGAVQQPHSDVLTLCAGPDQEMQIFEDAMSVVFRHY